MIIATAENDLKVKRAQLAASSNREEEKAIIAKEISRVDEQRTLEELKIDMNEKKYLAEVVVPAKAEKEAAELLAQGKAAKILENGKATAEALQLLQKQWQEGEKDETRDIMLLQMLPVLLKHVTHVLQDNLNIEKLTVIDSGTGNGGGIPKHVNNLSGSIVSIFEQLENATGIDIAGILKTKEKGSDTHFENQYNKQ
jgi:flotillin